MVDGRGNIYVNCGFGTIALVTTDGSVRQVADGIAFPNGMAISPDNSTLIISESHAEAHRVRYRRHGALSQRRAWAELGVGPPDGICLDADGAVWTQSTDTSVHTGNPDDPAGVFIRPAPCYHHTAPLPSLHFFMLAAQWRGPVKMAEVIAERTGQCWSRTLPSLAVTLIHRADLRKPLRGSGAPGTGAGCAMMSPVEWEG